MNIGIELKKINEKIDEHYLNFDRGDLSFIYIKMFNIEEYDNLIIEVNKKKYRKVYSENSKYGEEYLKIYFAKRKKYRNILKNLNNNEITINYPKDLEMKKDFIEKILNYNDDLTVFQNIKLNIKYRLEYNINEINDEIYKLKFLPHSYTNTLSTFIGPYKPTKFENDMIFYKDIFIAHKAHHHFGVYYNENSSEETKRALLNILAYLNSTPFFYFTDNRNFNEKLDDLYNKFDLLDLIRIRKKDYFDTDSNEPFYIESPIFKTKRNSNFISIDSISHEMIFELYHASLKQFEALPRCVFLYRAFEYGKNFYYNTTYNPPTSNPEDVLNHLYSLAINYRYIPLYYIDYGTYLNHEQNKVIRKRKASYKNFLTTLKNEAKKIILEWKSHSFLKDKSIGEIIYKTGRNASAHGGGARHNAKYDYGNNYKHINNVNIILELIVRYLIENMTPQIKTMIERKKSYYIKYNGYEKIFDKNND